MTEAEAVQWVNELDDDDELDEADLEEAFRALYGREPDEDDRAVGLWSLLCAAVSAQDAPEED
jgi:hypothetical protein